jgi:hypothetical protein
MTVILPGGIAVVAASAYSAWDPANAGTFLVLSNNNRTVQAPSGLGVSGSLRGTRSNTGGKKYFEVTLTTIDTGTSYSSGVGWGDANWGVGNWDNVLIGDNSGDSVGAAIVTGTPATLQIISGGVAGPAIAGTIVNGSVVGLAADLTNLAAIALSISVNGTWNNNGSPSTTLTAPDYTWNPASSVIYPGAGLSHTSNRPVFVLNVGNAAFAHAIPSGYTAWG